MTAFCVQLCWYLCVAVSTTTCSPLPQARSYLRLTNASQVSKWSFIPLFGDVHAGLIRTRRVLLCVFREICSNSDFVTGFASQKTGS